MPIKDTEERRTYQREWRAKRKEAGLCYACCNKSLPGKTMCQSCVDAKKEKDIKRREARRVMGSCIICNKGVKSTRFTCPDCIARQTDRNKRFREAVLDYYGRSCACCGEQEPMFLCIDHINNDGNAHRAKVGTGSNVMVWLVKNGFPEGFQTLCWNCNAGKQINGGVCPHHSVVN